MRRTLADADRMICEGMGTGLEKRIGGFSVMFLVLFNKVLGGGGGVVGGGVFGACWELCGRWGVDY